MTRPTGNQKESRLIQLPVPKPDNPELTAAVVPMYVEPKGVDRFHSSSRVDASHAVKIRNLMFDDGVLVSRLGTDFMGSNAASKVMQVVDFIRKGRKKLTIRFCLRHIEVYNYGALAWQSFPVPLTGSERDFFAYTGWADKLLFSNGVDGLWEFDLSTMVIKIVPDAPSAKHLTTFGNRVVASSTVEGGEDHPVRVRWTAKNDYRRWAESTVAVPLTTDLVGGFEDLYGAPGGITDEAMGVFPSDDTRAWLVRSRSTYQMSLSGNVLAPFRFDRVLADVGTPFRNTIMSTTSGIVFASRDEIHFVSEQGHQLIGTLVIDEIVEEAENLRYAYASVDVGRQEYRLAINKIVWRYRFMEQGWTTDEYHFDIRSLSRQIEGFTGLPIDSLVGIIDELPGENPNVGPAINDLIIDRSFDNVMMFVPWSSELTLVETDYPFDRLLNGEAFTDPGFILETGVVNLDALKACELLGIHGEYESFGSPIDAQALVLETSQNDGDTWLTYSVKEVFETSGSEIFFAKQERVSRKLRLRLSSLTLGVLRLLGLAPVLVKVERAMTMASNKPKPARIEILPNPISLHVGETQQLSIRVLGPGGQVIQNVAVTLISSNSAIATVTSTGLVRAISAGSFAISASVRNIQTSVSGTVLAVPVPQAATVTVIPDLSQGVAGSTQQFSATVRDASGNVLLKSVVWASSSPAFATINQSGLASLIVVGTVAISATVDGVTGSATLEITAAAAVVATVEVLPSGFALTVGQTTQLVARPKDSGGNVISGKTIAWTTDEPAVATVNATGLVTAVGAGAVNITATCDSVPGTSAGVVNVAAAAVATVVLAPASFSKPVGQTQQLTATVRDSAGNVLIGRPISWSSSNSSVATTDQTGLVTAVAAGSATISATSEGKIGSSVATVTPVAVASVTVSPASFSLNAGATMVLVATPKDSSGNSLSGRVIVWGSSDPTKATVSSTGVVTGVGSGSVTITATCETKQGTSSGTIGTATYSPISANSGVVYSPEPNPAGSLAEFPRIFLDSRYNRGGVAPTFASTVTLSNTGNRTTNRTNLQAAIDAAAARSGNSRILLPIPFPSAEIILKKHAFAGSRTFIEAVTMPTPEFTRVTPTSVPTWPEIQVTAGGGNAVSCAPGADGYRLQGLLFNAGPKTSVSVVYDLFKIESGDGTILGDVPTDIWIDRCLLRGGDTGSGIDNGNVRNGVLANGTRCGVVDSWIDQIGYTGFESHAIIAYNTPGPLKFVNNYCSATSISMLFGGDVPHLGVPAGNPSDIEIRHHYHSRPMEWAKDAPQWDGVNARGIKNLFESKNSHRMLVEGCIFENNWADGQGGMAIVIKSSVSATADATGIGTENLTIRHNIVRNSVRCWNFAGQPDELTATPVHAVCHFNNLAYNIGSFAGQIEGRAWIMTQTVDNLFCKHNTLVHNEFTAGIFSLDVPRTPGTRGFVFTDNLTTTGSPDYGVFMSGGAIGTAAIQAWTEDPYVWERNVLVGLAATVGLHPGGTNQFATNVGAVGFVDAANGNYALAASSTFKGDGEGGSDPGCDVAKVNLATAGVAIPAVQPCTVVVHSSPLPVSPFPKPAYLVPATEPNLGTKILRISDNPGNSIPTADGGTWPVSAQHLYAKVQPWSSDMALFFLNNDTAGDYGAGSGHQGLLLDGNTFAPIIRRTHPGSEARWHPSIPSRQIYVLANGSVGHWDPVTDSQPLDFTTTAYNNALMGSYEGNPSNDGRYVAVLATRNSDSKVVVFVVDIVGSTKSADIDVAAANISIDWASVSQSGNFLVLHGIIDGSPRRSKIYTRSGMTFTQTAYWTDHPLGHFDLGIDAGGNDVAFGGSSSGIYNNRFLVRRLDNAAVLPVSPVVSSVWHASCRNIGRPGWGYVTTGDTTGSYLDASIYAIKMDGTQIERWCRHRASDTTATHALGCPSPDGKRLAFRSDWLATTPVSEYVCDVRDICP